MNQDPKEIIFTILDIIEYPYDKADFVNDFIVVCKKQAVFDLISSLDQKKQELLKEVLSKATTEHEVSQIFKDYFSNEDYQNALSNATENTFKKLLETIIPDLSIEQRKKIKELLAALLPPTN